MIMGNPYLHGDGSQNVTTSVFNVSVEGCPQDNSLTTASPNVNSTFPNNSLTTNPQPSHRRRKRDASDQSTLNITLQITTATNWGQLMEFNTSDSYGMIVHMYVVQNPVDAYMVRITPNMTRYNETNGTLFVYIRADSQQTPLLYDYKIPEDRMFFLPPPQSGNVSQYYIGVQSAQGMKKFIADFRMVDISLYR